MLPSVMAGELAQAVQRFLRSAFPVATPRFQDDGTGVRTAHALIDAFLAVPDQLFKGPYLDIKLPFRRAADASLPFRHLRLPFVPYQHQLSAFRRLAGDAPRSTLIATGTGSGKTECFMLPILDDCLHRRERGIKAIVIYPMNALADDQARRFARETSKLDTRLTVGLFVGSEQSDADSTMGPDHVITDHQTLRDNPPDVLLTNYKMLDFLLIRPRNQPLWRYNQPGTLRYLVVDELHTFDGAQGTDLACLIRRLRDRLDAGPELACVGTSATLGSGARDALLAYARKVFAANFDADAVVDEDRLSPDEYLAGADNRNNTLQGEAITCFQWPDGDEPALDPARHERAEDYAQAQVQLWFADVPHEDLPRLDAEDPASRLDAALRLGTLLHHHQAFHALLRSVHGLAEGNGPVNVGDLAAEWQRRLNLPGTKQALRLLDSMTSLISVARRRRTRGEAGDEANAPLLDLRQQLWLRELRRLVCSVPADPAAQPAIRFADDLLDPGNLRDAAGLQHLPLLHCRNCHLAGWGAVQKEGDNHLHGGLQTFYQHWFGRSVQARLLVPRTSEECKSADNDPVQGFCPRCLRVQAIGSKGVCQECEQALVPVWVPDMHRIATIDGQQRAIGTHDCPECGARESLAIVGYRAASLISVMAARLFNSPYNDDCKLIAFSDSVQDAAHRAGFLGANTWRQVVRQAMAGWLRAHPDPASLHDMKSDIATWWQRKLGNDEAFCGLFIAPNMAWLRDYEALTKTRRLPAGSDLKELVGKRLAWECIAEFGRRSTIGRSMERTGVAAVGLDADALVADVATLACRLREEIDGLRNIDNGVFVCFIAGWLHHMRQIGAIHDPALDGYLRKKGDEYQLNVLITWMPSFGRSTRPPAAVSLGHVANNFEALVLGNRDTWAVRWLKKTLGREHVLVAAEARQIFHACLQSLMRAGWLVERDAGGESVYLLDPERLLVDSHNQCAVCDTCSHPLFFVPASDDLYEGMACLRPQCPGHMHARKRDDEDPDRLDYGVTGPRRLVPHEHTGLLPSATREWVEHSFMQGTDPWDINVLSATPTLEMGIDIGELSTVFLCSVPPTQANYLQRIGRAGRRDGNALAVTVANGRNHDLYFDADPMQMIAGQVHTPGVFLEATAVLERQLIAYCFDRWAATGVDDSAIPGQLRKVLDAVEHQRRDQFPYNLIGFVVHGRDALVSSFFTCFDTLGEDARDHLSHFIRDDGEQSLSWRLVNRLQQLAIERGEFVKKARRLKVERERLQQLPQDEATRERVDLVERERGAVLSLLSNMNTRSVLNFFADEGLLPNYAFPEAGVTLQSVILRRLPDGQRDANGSRYQRLSYSFQRPAQAALSELAPENRFYAVSHELQIDKIDLDTARDEDWRFCDRCQYTERVDADDRHSACPRCGSAQWADSGQKHKVLRLRQVYSTVSDRDSRISDDAEQREPAFFNRQMLLDVPLDASAGGFRLKSDDLPFGFEFLRRVTLREVNFGAAGGQGQSFAVAGRALSRPGFRICRHCGKVQKARWRRNEPHHDFTCPLSQHPEQDTPDAYFESLYLYRELQSEAVRILLPLSEVAYSDEKLHSFVAALNLGLRRYFHGDVHHLQVTDMRDPATSQSGEKVYLVVYDRIPGGTGYLKELMRDSGNLKEVFAKAYARLTTCECMDDENRDGCYRCILAYRDSRNMPTISRKVAAELLHEILERWDQLEMVDSLATVSTNALIESKLEQRFVDALGMLRGARLTKSLVHGKAGYLLTMPGVDGRPVAWRVELQVQVGPADGIARQTRIDVLLRPGRAADADRVRPIAIYLDGLQYHHERVADDVEKRMALLLSGQYWVYSLNWDDLPEPGKAAKGHDDDLMRVDGRAQDGMNRLYDGLATSVDWARAAEHGARNGWGSLEWLDRLLRDPDVARGEYSQRATWRALTTLVPQVVKDAAVRDALVEELAVLAPTWIRTALKLADMDQLPGGFMQAFANALLRQTLTVALPASVLQSNDAKAIAEAVTIHVCFDDRDTELTDAYKSAWRSFWHAVNQLQFAPGFSMATRRGVEVGALDRLWQDAEAEVAGKVTKSGHPDNHAWAEVFELSTLPAEQLRGLSQLGLPEPEVGVDLVSAGGDVAVGGDQVELCWREPRVAVLAAGVNAALPGWSFVLAGDAMLQKITELKDQGVF